MKNLFYITIMLIALACTNAKTNSSSENANEEASVSWNIYRGNSALQGYADVSISDSPTMLWSVRTNKRTLSSPVVTDGMVYWSDKDNFVRGVKFTKDTGSIVLNHDFKIPFEATPLIVDSVLYVGDVQYNMYAFSLNSHKLLWTFQAEGQITGSANYTVINNEPCIIFGSYDYNLYCVNANTGTLKFKIEADNFINGTPAISNNMAVFGGCDAKLRFIDLEKGTAAEVVDLDVYIPASPTIDNQYMYVGDYDGTIYKINNKTKQSTKIHSAKVQDAAYLSMPVFDNENVYFSSENKSVYALNKETNQEVWKTFIGAVAESAPVITKNKMIVCSKSGQIFLLDIKTGNITWQYDTGEPIIGAPAVINKHFFVLTRRGTLFCFSS